MPQDLTCDVAIIGAGTAGLSAERSARRAGASTLLIDPAFAGTTCATVGCMPSKLLIAAGRAAHGVRQADAFGLEASLRIDGPAVLRRVRRERDAFAEATREQIADLPDGVAVKATAQFLSADTLRLDDGRTVTARAVVIATGSRPSVPDTFDVVADLILTNETVFDLEDLPATLAVVGAGPLGLELAQAMARLGVAVAVFDQGETVAGVDDEKVADALKTALGREFDIHLGVELEAASHEGKARLTWSGASAGVRDFDRVLVAAGRPPSLTGLSLEATELDLDEHGTPVCDRETMRCGRSNIFLAGDAVADRPVLHEASSEGAIAGANAATLPRVAGAHRCVPFSIMFTDPPLALVGRHGGHGLATGETDYGDQGRAKVEAKAEGLARLFADAADGRTVGAILFCPGADHLGHLLAWSIETGATAADLLQRPFYHPTFEEGLKPALRAISAAVGLTPPAMSDEGGPSGA
jgi:dihydrolipoamide dehydrogenase